jgi:hypothetical protein
MKHERIIPFIAQENRDVVMQYPVEVIDPEDYETFVSQMVPFETDQGNYLSSLPPILLIRSQSSHYHVFASDLQQCQEEESQYTCPKSILNNPAHNICFQAHLANNMDAIQAACDLTKAHDLNTMIELDNGLLYYDLPEDAKVARQCQTIEEIAVEGNGLMTIPSGCSIIYKMKSFLNRMSRKAIQTQEILQIAEELLTHPEYANSIWNRAKKSLGTAALSVILAIVCSLIVTQFSSICAFLGILKVRKTKKLRRVRQSDLRSSEAYPARFTEIPPAPAIENDLTTETYQNFQPSLNPPSPPPIPMKSFKP